MIEFTESSVSLPRRSELRSPLPGGVCHSSKRNPSPPQSVYDSAQDEADRHKWIESQKRGCDLGRQAQEDWYQRFWHNYCRAKRLEHLTGHQQWVEFADHEFGQMYQHVVSGNQLLTRILEKIEAGAENLDIICWGHDEQLPMAELLTMLEMVNINIARLEPRLRD